MDDDTVRMIFVSHHGQHQRHRPTVYGDVEQTPVATLVAPETVRLSLGSVAGFSLREDRWRDLKVIYDYHAPMRRDPDRP
jgi:hypothetical protein